MGYSNSLYHHGILGQKWGVRNGPPYPLGASDHSASEKRAGWKKSLDKSGQKTDNKVVGSSVVIVNGRRVRGGIALTDGQRKAMRVGMTAAALALATYGAYRMGYLDKDTLGRIHDVGKNVAGDVLKKIGDKPISEFKAPNILGGEKSAFQNPAAVIRDPKTGFKRINETLNDSLRNANPLRGSAEGGNNCTYSAVAGFLRTMGYDVTAKSTGGEMQNFGGVLEDCFKGVQVHEGSATKFAKSPADAAEMLKKRFGDNASGAVGVQWRGKRGGHAFSWKISNGVVDFLDYQKGTSGSVVKDYWHFIDPNGSLQFARLDDLEINAESIKKYVNGR